MAPLAVQRRRWALCVTLFAVTRLETECFAALRGRRVAMAAMDLAAPPLESPAWTMSVAAIVEGIECTDDDATNWLQAGFAWTQKSRRFWRKSRTQEDPEPEAVKATVEWLKNKGLAEKSWVNRFPEVIGLSVEDLEAGRETAPSYLQKEEVYFKAIRANPQLLGKNYDCLAEHESCQGKCSRCWNT
mmetsp:Transcript_96286/g.171036  ORF Transcript_96286/g.171036 Transcript_96286/m.171036 type:complete len:187 (+) Transcript_96286:41-601(+)|eukprot:CAMPEP_0197629772 /NCGR_PEP_ID=MMETSP1338-20131121/7496_1 /TAXON_ID=43686 ORGANISM="Pelagodinium beii, Strain RCC1491" /NCGR_SAMPLE_ID=MMETSP1338 /ASSEMBLY_ACC=CAM_ASM_000754 /LENGTH=186 /DNA_ID=CAMNT_0043200867 /DNA_START=36 /DNA_END=596 /DNA_ORIENTATION=-